MRYTLVASILGEETVVLSVVRFWKRSMNGKCFCIKTTVTSSVLARGMRSNSISLWTTTEILKHVMRFSESQSTAVVEDVPQQNQQIDVRDYFAERAKQRAQRAKQHAESGR